MDCGATLIVSPSSILEQWRNEIAKHTREGAFLPVPVCIPLGHLALHRVAARLGWTLLCSDCEATLIVNPSSITRQWKSRKFHPTWMERCQLWSNIDPQEHDCLCIEAFLSALAFVSCQNLLRYCVQAR